MWAVELHREESRRAAQDRIRPAQLLDLTIQLGQPGHIIGCRSGPGTAINLRALGPASQRVGGNIELLPDARTFSAVTEVATTRLDHDSDSALFQLGRILLQCWHLVLNLSGDQEPPLNPGRNIARTICDKSTKRIEIAACPTIESASTVKSGSFMETTWAI